MNPKRNLRLGRGLSSLISLNAPAEEPAAAPEAVSQRISDVPGQDAPATGEIRIRVELIDPNPHQPRRRFNDDSLAQLAQSLKATGLIQPIVVRPAGERYELIAGERRLRAAKLAGLVELPAIVRPADALTQAELALVENVQREDLNPIDRAAAYRLLLEKLNLTQQDLADRLAEERSTIANHVRLLELAHPVQEMIRQGSLSLGHAKLLAGVPDVLQQQKLAEMVVAQQLSVRALEKLLTETPGSPPPAAAPKPSAHIADLERSLSQQLGMRVQVRRGGKGKGRLVIHYATLEQFDELMNKLSLQTHD